MTTFFVGCADFESSNQLTIPLHLRETKVSGANEYAGGPGHAQHAASTYFNMRKTSIYGGSNEIQRNIITKMILGL
jgi:alkylation response protein AidB-like acyl-CoA dehydrogenase